MSDQTIDDDTLRAMIAARTPGEWAPYCDEGPIRYRYLAPDGDGWTYSVCVGGHGDDHTCVLTATGPDVATAHANAAMAAVAPALAAEVLRLRTECDVLRHERDEHAHKAGEWEESHDIELARAKKVEAAARAYRDATDVGDGEYDATRHAEALAELDRVLGGGQ